MTTYARNHRIQQVPYIASHLFFLIFIGFWFVTELVLKLLPLLLRCYSFSSHTILHHSSHNMSWHEPSALLHPCQYLFPCIKPPWQPQNHFHLLLQTSGMHYQIIFHPFQLFLLLEALSNIIFFCWLTLTVVQNLVRPNQLSVSHFMIQHQLLPSHNPERQYYPAKGVPSERLRLFKA